MNKDYHSIFINHLKSYGHISEAAEKDLFSKINPIHCVKGHHIIKEGQIESSFFIVQSGMVRSYYHRNERETTIWFAYEGQSAVACSSLFDNRPSLETVECVEECDLIGIPNRELRELYNKHQCMNTIGRKIVESYYSILEYRIYSLQVMSATERYKKLMEAEPEIIRRAPLGNIASFLGISQETLSRIRHNR